MGSTPLLFPILTDLVDIKRESRRRGIEFEFKQVAAKNHEKFLSDGWEYDRRLKQRVRLKRKRSVDEILENQVWCLLAKMDYREMNKGRDFKIRYKRDGAADAEEQIDIFAKDDETIVIAKCKSATEQKKKPLGHELDAFVNAKKGMSTSIRTHFGRDFKPKILWLFITENVVWTDTDLETAKSHGIKVITERELRYLRELVTHLGFAAKYQFLAEYLEGQSIPELANKKVPAIRGKLGGHSFYCFVATPRQLLKLAFINHRALNDPAGVPTYQRLTQRSRLKKIGAFLLQGGYFPTNLLINFKKKLRFDISVKDAEADVHFGNLYLPDTYKSAWVIDGQHRLFGYCGLDEKKLRQNLLVLAFENMPRREEADLFVTINHEQKSVPRNLLDDLEGELLFGSDRPVERIGANCSLIVRALNNELGSPLFNRVTEPGIRATEDTCLTIPELKAGLRQSGLLGTAAEKNKIFQPGPLCSDTDEDTLVRARKVLASYFSLIKDASPERWSKGRDGLLCVNPGIRGFLMLLANVIAYASNKTSQDLTQLTERALVAKIQPYLQPLIDYLTQVSDDEFSREFKVPFGAGGPPQYANRLYRLIRKRYADFSPAGYLEWEKSQSGEQVLAADQRLKEIEKTVRSHVSQTLRKAYGDDYWEKGIPQNEIKLSAYGKKLEDEEKGLPMDTYLNLVDLKRIVEHRSNWNYFKPVLDIPLKGIKGLAKNLEWMVRLNKIRRIPAHPSELRTYSNDDHEFLEWLDELLKVNIQKFEANGGFSSMSIRPEKSDQEADLA
jgi:DGQHR domain-containing protein